MSLEEASQWVYHLYYETEHDGMQREVMNEENWEECRGVLLDQARGKETLARVDVEVSFSTGAVE